MYLGTSLWKPSTWEAKTGAWKVAGQRGLDKMLCPVLKARNREEDIGDSEFVEAEKFSLVLAPVPHVAEGSWREGGWGGVAGGDQAGTGELRCSLKHYSQAATLLSVHWSSNHAALFDSDTNLFTRAEPSWSNWCYALHISVCCPGDRVSNTWSFWVSFKPQQWANSTWGFKIQEPVCCGLSLLLETESHVIIDEVSNL